MGRYIGGLVPDLTFTADSSIQPLWTTSWVSGVEQKVSSVVSLAGYYSGVDTKDGAHIDTDGHYIGYGYPGSSNSNNMRIEELTFTSSLLAFKTSNRGSAQINLQASWLEREAWVARKRAGLGFHVHVLRAGSLQPALIQVLTATPAPGPETVLCGHPAHRRVHRRGAGSATEAQSPPRSARRSP